MKFSKSGKVDLWIIGYGNRHRRDDGAGRYVARQLMPRYAAVESVHIRSLHQLGPELAEDLQAATRIIFIDAILGAQSGYGRWQRVQPVADMEGISHGLTADILIGLTELIYNRCPPAWMVSIPGEDFSFGEGLSRTSSDYAMRATREIAHVIDCCLKDKKCVTYVPAR